MTDLDLFDTSAVQDDAKSWDALAERITASVVGSRSDSVLGWLASPRAAALIACLMVAFVLLLARQAEAPRAAIARDAWTPLLSPSDEVGRTFTSADGPPAVERLLRDRGDIK
jgi:hypothetical protein